MQVTRNRKVWRRASVLFMNTFLAIQINKKNNAIAGNRNAHVCCYACLLKATKTCVALILKTCKSRTADARLVYLKLACSEDQWFAVKIFDIGIGPFIIIYNLYYDIETG